MPRRLSRPALALLAVLPLAGCGVTQGDLLPAVFGFGEGGVSNFSPGTLPVVEARPGDRLVGQSGADAGRCIWLNDAGRRFRADCPPDYRP